MTQELSLYRQPLRGKRRFLASFSTLITVPIGETPVQTSALILEVDIVESSGDSNGRNTPTSESYFNQASVIGLADGRKLANPLPIYFPGFRQSISAVVEISLDGK